MKIYGFDGKKEDWYMAEVEHYNEEWLKWIIADLYEKLKDANVANKE